MVLFMINYFYGIIWCLIGFFSQLNEDLIEEDEFYLNILGKIILSQCGILMFFLCFEYFDKIYFRYLREIESVEYIRKEKIKKLLKCH